MTSKGRLLILFTLPKYMLDNNGNVYDMECHVNVFTQKLQYRYKLTMYVILKKNNSPLKSNNLKTECILRAFEVKLLSTPIYMSKI